MLSAENRTGDTVKTKYMNICLHNTHTHTHIHTHTHTHTQVDRQWKPGNGPSPGARRLKFGLSVLCFLDVSLGELHKVTEPHFRPYEMGSIELPVL